MIDRTLNDSPTTLTDGTWVLDPRTRVMRWHPAGPMRLADEIDQRGPVVCHCGARATETCRTKAGHRTKNHTYRQSSRVCPCGAEIKWKGRLCRDCRDTRDNERKRAWKDKQRAAQEAA